MARALSIDLRHWVLRSMREGGSTHAAAERFRIAITTAVLSRLQDRAGRSDPLPMGGYHRSGHIEVEAKFLQTLVVGKDDIALHDMQRRLADERRFDIGIGTLWRFFNRHRTTWKKTAHASEQERPELLKLRRAWFDDQLDLDPAKVVFIDVGAALTSAQAEFVGDWNGNVPSGKPARIVVTLADGANYYFENKLKSIRDVNITGRTLSSAVGSNG